MPFIFCVSRNGLILVSSYGQPKAKSFVKAVPSVLPLLPPPPLIITFDSLDHNLWLTDKCLLLSQGFAQVWALSLQLSWISWALTELLLGSMRSGYQWEIDGIFKWGNQGKPHEDTIYKAVGRMKENQKVTWVCDSKKPWHHFKAEEAGQGRIAAAKREPRGNLGAAYTWRCGFQQRNGATSNLGPTGRKPGNKYTLSPFFLPVGPSLLLSPIYQTQSEARV